MAQKEPKPVPAAPLGTALRQVAPSLHLIGPVLLPRETMDFGVSPAPF